MKRAYLAVLWVLASLFITICALPSPAGAERVRMITTLGNIDIELFEDLAPLTVANFLSYMDARAYNGTVIHRSKPDFVIQGGGYYYQNNDFILVDKKEPIVNEYHLSNTRGTIAMAKVADNPDSATCEWFFNLVDNSANLDNQNGGFTVFGQVTEESLAVMDAIATVQPYNVSQRYGSAFTDLPLIDGQYLVMVYAILYSGVLSRRLCKICLCQFS
jgi:cyclophilin family peptidyl-prolyl cis-trans isomerase